MREMLNRKVYVQTSIDVHRLKSEINIGSEFGRVVRILIHFRHNFAFLVLCTCVGVRDRTSSFHKHGYCCASLSVKIKKKLKYIKKNYCVDQFYNN